MCSQGPGDGTGDSALAAPARMSCPAETPPRETRELGQHQVSGVAHLPNQDWAAQSRAQALLLLGKGETEGSTCSLNTALGRQLL